MKTKAIKLIALLAAAVMVFTLAGCGGGGSSSTPDSSDTGNAGGEKGGYKTWEEIKATIPADAKGKTIEFFTWNQVTDVTGAPEVVENFEKETGIKINFNVNSGTIDDYMTKIIARVASQESPDIVRLRGTELGVLQVLQDLNTMDYDFSDEAWDTRISDIYTFGGKTYATTMRNTLLHQPRVMIYNKNLISKYDLEDPYTLWKQGKWTWEKFEEICQIYNDETEDSCYAWTSYRWAECPDAFGSAMIKREGDTFVSNVTDANLLRGWQYMTELRVEGITNNIRFDRPNFENNKVLFFTESPIGVRRTHYYFKNLKAAGAVAMVPVPTFEGGLGNDTVILSEVEAYGIPQGAPAGSLAPYFMRYYLDAENYDEKTFFADPTMLDVYKTIMASEKVFVNYDTELITEDVGKGGIHVNASIVNAMPANVKTKLDENANLVEAAVKNANGIIEGKLGK